MGSSPHANEVLGGILRALGQAIVMRSHGSSHSSGDDQMIGP